jgi:hypothetical protein
MAVPLLTEQYIRRELERLRCTKLFELSTAGMWMTRTGYHFTVPQEGPDKQCSKYIFEMILDEIKPHL